MIQFLIRTTLSHNQNNIFMKERLLEKPIYYSKRNGNWIRMHYALLFFIFFSLVAAQAQTTAIPDTSFEISLINEGLDSGPLDGQVLTANISGITVLNIQGGSIKDLTGIKDFTSLQELYLNYQQVVSLDLSGMTNLKVVELYNNGLTSIDVKNLPNLETLRCGMNHLTTLDLTGLPNLTYLGCGQNALTSLEVTGSNKLVNLHCGQNQLTSLDLGSLSNLSSLICESNQLTSLNLTGLTQLTDLRCDSNQISTLNLSGLTELAFLTCSQNKLGELNLSNSTKYTYINCSANNLMSLDITNKPNLSAISCNNNPALDCISVDDVANANANTNNEIWEKDLAASYALACTPKANNQSFCYGATVANLVAIGNATKWYTDPMSGTPLATTTPLITGTYYVSQTINGNESQRISVAVNINTTPLPSRNESIGGTLCRPSTYSTLASKFNNSSEIKIYATETSTTPLDSSLEITPVATFLTLYITQTINGCESARLQDTQTYVNPNYEPTAVDQTFCAKNMPTVANLVATANGSGNTIKWYTSATRITPLQSTTGLSTRDYYVSQSAYPCGESTRKKIHVTVNEDEDIYIYTCGSYTWPLNGETYTESSNPSFDDGCAIHHLYLTITPVATPEINSQFRINSSTIADITINQGYNIQWYADAIGGSPLPSTTLLQNKTYYATQSENYYDPITQCESEHLAVDITIGIIPEDYTYIADTKFEQALIDLGYDDVIDSKVLNTNIASVTSLNLVAKNIHQLTGIKGFKSLVSLEMIYNSVSDLDVSGMTTLEYIGAYGNYITTVNLSGLSNLKILNLGNSSLQTLDLTGLTALEKMECSGNPITELKLSGLTNLTSLDCRNTNIISLDLTKTPNLISLACTGIQTLSCIIVNDIESANTNTSNETWTKDFSATYSLGTTTTTTETACNNYTWAANGKNYTSNGTYSYANGCDTQILNLTILPNSTETSVSSCNSYTWNGTTYYSTGKYSHPNGCSTDYLYLTITPDTTNTTTIVACDTYIWEVNGTTYTTSGIYYTQLKGCHTEVLDLTITPSTTNTITIVACDTYTWAVNGTTYTSSGIYKATTVNCITQELDLTITPINDTVSFSNGIITANTSNATYQWVDCANNQPINGATDQSFTPTISGSYSVIISLGNCSLTSACVTVTTLGTIDLNLVSELKIYPNPSHDVFNIEINKNALLEIFDPLGQKIKTENIIQGNSKLDLTMFPTGVYFIKITNENKRVTTMKIIRN